MYDGYLPHAATDWPDAPAGDALAAALSAAHAGRADEAASLTARLHALADRVAGRALNPLARHQADEALKLVLAGLEELEAAL